MIHVKRIKRICGVRGCKNIVTYSVSRYSEGGNSVIICKECLKGALDAIEKMEGQAIGNSKPESHDKEKKPTGHAVSGAKTSAQSTRKEGKAK